MSDVITTPGKFEGCPPWAVEFWDTVLDGGEDDREEVDGVLVSIFSVTDRDRDAWPVLANVARIRIWEDDQGFVHTETIPID